MLLFKNLEKIAIAAFADALLHRHPVLQFDVAGVCLSANAALAQEFALDASTLTGLRFDELFAEPAAAQLSGYWQTVIAGHAPPLICQIKTMTQSVRWVQLAPTLVPGKSTGANRIVFLVLDVTETEEAHRNGRREFAAANEAHAALEFNAAGTILEANETFARMMGYSTADIIGRHHDILIKDAYHDREAKTGLWKELNNGRAVKGEFKRVSRSGGDVWVVGSYTPILDQSGKTIKVLHVAFDATDSKLSTSNLAAQVAAIGRSQAVIEFNMDGTIITANDNFLGALGYELGEIIGRHHRLFVTDEEKNSVAYLDFWRQLNEGQYMTGEYHRVGKAGNSVWIQASYNPVFDLDGKPVKIVKYATETTVQVRQRMANERVRGMMESVAAGAEELNASVREISEAMTKSRETATSAVLEVEAADAQASRLNEAAIAMSGIVDMIGKITGQINLLALNATIESARAGEAGRGFAVVASEVKNLANQAKQATDKIGKEISSLNDISGEVVGALGKIKSAMQNVSEYVTTTAAAVEEQSVVTSEMSSSMQRAASQAAAAVALDVAS